MFRKKNIEAIIQIIILIAIAFLLLNAMLSNKVSYYVHPRYNFGIWSSIIILLIFAISILSNIKKARHNVNTVHYMIFVVPLIAALIFPASGVSGKDMTIANSISESDSVNINDKNNENATNSVRTDSKDNTEDNDNINSDITTEKDSATNNSEGENASDYDVSEKYIEYEENGVMIINDDIFAEWLGDVYDNLDDFEGKRCQYIAQVYSMDGLEENQFLAGRYFMVCCAADLVGYGIVCESDKRSEFTDDEWITVTGTIEKLNHDGEEVPMITDVTISEAEAPPVEYIYFNNY